MILLVIIALTSCSREEEKTTGVNTYGLVDFSKKDDNITKQRIIHSYETDVYNHIDEKYKRYIEGHNVNYEKYNKNGEHLIFPFHNLHEIVNDQHIVIFKYYDNILITSYDYNITNDYYIDLKNMYYFVSLEENEKIKELFEKTPMEYRCKVSRNDDYTIKFYDEICEKRIKEMLKMTSANKVHEEKNINDIENQVYKTIEEKYGRYLNGRQLNLKEFNKNGRIIVFENNKEDKNNHLIIVKKNDKFYTCYQPIKDFVKNKDKTKCLKKDGNVNLDVKNFKMHYIVPLNYEDYWKKLLNITDNRKLTKEEFQTAKNIHNALPKEVRTKNLDAFVYEKYKLSLEERRREQAIHLIIKDGIVVYYHHYYADLNKLFK